MCTCECFSFEHHPARLSRLAPRNPLAATPASHAIRASQLIASQPRNRKRPFAGRFAFLEARSDVGLLQVSVPPCPPRRAQPISGSVAV